MSLWFHPFFFFSLLVGHGHSYHDISVTPIILVWCILGNSDIFLCLQIHKFSFIYPKSVMWLHFISACV